MKDQEQCIKIVETSFDRIFDRRDEPLPASLMRSAAKTIALSYPDNQHRTLAIGLIIDAARHLKLAGIAGKTPLS